jgi:hypothetical protein
MIDESKTTDPVKQHRFYFHINNGSRYPDETGSVFSSAGNAGAHAAVVAQWRKTRAGVDSSLS